MILRKVLKMLYNNNSPLKSQLVRRLSLIKKAPIYFLIEFLRFLRGEFIRVPNFPIVRKITHDINFLFDFYFDQQIHQMYKKTYHLHVIRAMKKILEEGDIFIDVGASIGYLSSIGASLVGKKGEVHSFEPVPTYFQRLQKTSQLNKDYKMMVNNVALADYSGKGKIRITDHTSVGWNSMVPKFIRKEDKKIIKINVIRLDDYIFKNNLGKVKLIKIDVEGFENEVLKGLSEFLKKGKDLPYLIVEIMPSSAYDLKELKKYMNKYGFRTYDLLTEKPLDISKLNTHTDVLFKHIN